MGDNSCDHEFITTYPPRKEPDQSDHYTIAKVVPVTGLEGL
jgi:hypothetical protein